MDYREKRRSGALFPPKDAMHRLFRYTLKGNRERRGGAEAAPYGEATASPQGAGSVPPRFARPLPGSNSGDAAAGKPFANTCHN